MKKNHEIFVASLRKHEAEILTKENVVGCGVGEKIKGGAALGKICVKVYVEKKIPEARLSKKDIIAKNFPSIETDVEEVGRLVAFSNTARVRPAQPGVSIGHYKITAGTFGCLVEDKETREIFILSNNHVLANSNHAKKGDEILQPGAYDGGKKPKDVIATLERWLTVDFKGGANHVDAALALPENKKWVKPEIIQIGLPAGAAKAKIKMFVQKSGRTTGYTTGVVKDVHATVKINYDKEVALFKNQILTTSMSSGGDSGSLVLNKGKKAVGLLFAGSQAVTILNPVQEVLKNLNVSLYLGR